MLPLKNTKEDSAAATEEEEKKREEFRKLMRTYAGFQAAAIALAAAKPENFCAAKLAIFLLAISIPSTIAYAGLARLTPKDEKRNPGLIMAICFCCAFVLSIAAFSILVASASASAAIAFAATCLAWFIVVWRLRIDHDHVNDPGQPLE